MASPTLTIPDLPSDFPTITASQTAEPSLGYIWGTPMTDTEKLLCQIFGYGCLVVLGITCISALVWLLIIKPRKVKAAEKAWTNGDLERQKAKRYVVSHGRLYKTEEQWTPNSTVKIASPPLTAMPPGRARSKNQKRPRIDNPASFR